MSSQRVDSPGYRSYLLRLWRTQCAGATVWRAALEEPLTQEVIHFDSLPELFAFLLARIAPDRQSDHDAGPILPPLGP